MNRIITIVTSILASLAVLNGAAAQQHAVRAVIPFDFTVAGTQMPAGAYTIATKDGLTSITENGSGVFKFVSVVRVDSAPGNGKLVFSTDGEQHFLRKVLCPDFNMNLEFVQPKSETKARERTARNLGN